MLRFKEMYRNPLVNIAFTFIEPLPVGLLMTLISGFAVVLGLSFIALGWWFER